MPWLNPGTGAAPTSHRSPALLSSLSRAGISIRAVRQEEMPAVRALFLAGMRPYADQFSPGSGMHKFWLQYTEAAVKDDISDRGVQRVYTGAGGGFWVATEEGDPNRLVGCVAAEKVAETVVELRRMSVSPECRGRGVGKLLCW